MDKCSVLFAFLFVVSPVLGQSKAQVDNYKILNKYCETSTRNTLQILQVFQLICPGNQPVECCNNIGNQIQNHPDWYLCAKNQQGFQFVYNGCTPAINSRNSFDAPNGVQVADSQIYFPSEQLNQRLQQSAQSANQKQPGFFEINFKNDPQNNIQVPTVPSRPPPANGMNQPVKQSQNAFNGGSAHSNNNDDDDNDDDDRVPVEYNSKGYQALDFALNLFKNLDRPANGDSVISPLLPQQLLSNLAAYASPLAQKQLQSTVKLHPQQLYDMTKTLDKISKSTVNTIETAAANFVANDVKLNYTFESDARVRNVDVLRVDFTKPNQAAKAANNWVSDKTHQLINEILNPGAINPYTRLLLANTIYFKGKWKYTFIESKPGTFESTPNNPRQLSKMFQLNKLRYGELSFSDGNGLRWVELPYEGGNLAMLVFLPTQRHNLEASLRQLQPQDLAKVMAQMQTSYINTKVHLHMPKFTLSDTVSLIPALKKMGVHSIFQDPDALQYLTSESMVVADVTQRSYMSVDEFGTKATSVASLSIITLSITPQYKDVRFDVDEPFLVMLVDKQERYPFFIGQIYDPQE